MDVFTLFANGVHRTIALSGATLARFCVAIGFASAFTGLGHPVEQHMGEALAAALHALSVIVACVAALGLAGFIGAAAIAPLRGERPLARLLGEGLGFGLSAGLLTATLLAALTGAFQAARFANAF